MNQATRRNVVGVSIALSALWTFAAAGPGHCDVTLHLETRQTSGQAVADSQSNPPETSSETVAFKGKMARIDDPNGVVRIYDGAKGRIYTLDPTDKSYRVAALKEAWKVTEPILRLSAGTEYDGHIKLTKTDTTTTEAGTATVRYQCTGSAEPRAPEVQGPRDTGRPRGGGRRGRGEFPGGGFPGGGLGVNPMYGAGGGQYAGARGRPDTTVDVAGELYLTSSMLLPDGNQWVIGALVETMIPRSPMLKPCIDRLNRLKMVPLASNLTFNFHGTNPNRDPITIETHVKSISEGPIDESQFTVPADYHMSSAR